MKLWWEMKKNCFLSTEFDQAESGMFCPNDSNKSVCVEILGQNLLSFWMAA
jgi:hypothetical protein